jgi:hypothetical protein
MSVWQPIGKPLNDLGGKKKQHKKSFSKVLRIHIHQFIVTIANAFNCSIFFVA